MLVSTAQGLPAAASAPAAHLLQGPARPGQVVASTSHLIGVLVEDADPGLVCVTGPGAARLPCAMALVQPVPRIGVGAPVTVGDGRLHLPGIVVSAARWKPATSPAVRDPLGAAMRAARCPPPVFGTGPLGTEIRTAAAALAGALHSPALSLDDAVTSLLGLGDGLTPLGDDVLAGAVVTSRAVRDDDAGRFAAAIVAADPFRRTTAVSAGLLAYATRGRCVPELAAFLTVLGDPHGDAVRLRAARHALLAVGHTSGAGLYAGVLAALAGPASLAPERRRT